MSQITDYATLVAALNGDEGWGHRTYSSDKIDEFIGLAETRINSMLRVRQMEVALASTAIASGLITRPTDLLAFKALWSDTNNFPPVEQKSLEYVMQHRSDGSIPQFYAWERSSLRFNTDSGNVAGVYYEKIPALTSTATTNWLLTARPDIYLSCVLAEAYQYARDAAAGNEIAKSDGLIQGMMILDQRDRFSGNSMVVRVA